MGAAAPHEQAHSQPMPPLFTAPPILTPALPCPAGAATPWGQAAGIRGAARARQPQTLPSRRPRVSRSWGGVHGGWGAHAVPVPKGQNLPAWAGLRKVKPWMPELPGASTGLRVCRVGYSGRCGKLGCPPIRLHAADLLGGLLRSLHSFPKPRCGAEEGEV